MQALHTTTIPADAQHSGSKSDTMDRQKTLSTRTRVREVTGAASIVLTRVRSDTTKKTTIDPSTAM